MAPQHSYQDCHKAHMLHCEAYSRNLGTAGAVRVSPPRDGDIMIQPGLPHLHGPPLHVQATTKNIVLGELLKRGYSSVSLTRTGIACIPFADAGVEAIVAGNAEGGPSIGCPELAFYGVCHPDQVLPHYVLELTKRPRDHAPGTDNADLFTFTRLDDPESPAYARDFVENLRAGLAPEYQLDEVDHPYASVSPSLRLCIYVSVIPCACVPPYLTLCFPVRGTQGWGDRMGM